MSFLMEQTAVFMFIYFAPRVLFVIIFTLLFIVRLKIKISNPIATKDNTIPNAQIKKRRKNVSVVSLSLELSTVMKSLWSNVSCRGRGLSQQYLMSPPALIRAMTTLKSSVHGECFVSIKAELDTQRFSFRCLSLIYLKV